MIAGTYIQKKKKELGMFLLRSEHPKQEHTLLNEHTCIYTRD